MMLNNSCPNMKHPHQESYESDHIYRDGGAYLQLESSESTCLPPM